MNQSYLTSTYDDDLLYVRLKSKTRSSFDYLYDNYAAVIYGSIAHFLKDEDGSDDALVEVFVKIWNSLDEFKPTRCRLFIWMLNIARDYCQSVLRLPTAKVIPINNYK